MENRNLQNSKNIKASENIASNAIFCLQNSLSAASFVKLNNKDALEKADFPTKNDGMQHFFQLREIIYDNLLESIKEKLRYVRSFSFSLDKVTIRLVPYTVLVTYFYFKGKLHIYLNSIHPMKSFEYSGEETAKFVGEELMRTLGLTRNEVASKVTHGVYDGVYASREERVRGGGSLRKVFQSYIYGF